MLSHRTRQAQLDAQACYGHYSNGVTHQYEFCAPASVEFSQLRVSGRPRARRDLGSQLRLIHRHAQLLRRHPSVATINATTNVITAQQPGTTAITATIAQSASSAGYFSTCPPASINVTLANGSTKGVVTQGVTQNLTTTVTDTQGNPSRALV